MWVLIARARAQISILQKIHMLGNDGILPLPLRGRAHWCKLSFDLCGLVRRELLDMKRGYYLYLSRRPIKNPE